MTDESRKGIHEEEVIRKSALSSLEFWAGTKPKKPDESGGLTSDKNQEDTVLPHSIHKECLVTSLCQGKAVSIQGSEFHFSSMVGSEGTERRETSSLYQDDAASPGSTSSRTTHDVKVLSINILPVGPKIAASIQVQVEIRDKGNRGDKPTIHATIHGFLTLLKSTYWTCISAAFSTNTGKILPEHFNAVTKLTWNGYCGANRARDGAAMAKVFHPNCRLTYVQDDSMVAVVPQPAFCSKVQNRYTPQEPMHQPYAPIQAHPDIGMHDTLQAVEFATPDCCMVTLKVGHPPCLWSDLLTCCYFGSDQGWWIAHKSSCHEGFPLTDDMKALLDKSKQEERLG